MAEIGMVGTPDDLRALLAGIDAAPASIDRDAWLALVAPDAPADVADRLRRVREALPRPQTAQATTGSSAERLSALRAALKEHGLDGFAVPRADEHQSEDLPARAERLAWLTGFTGSAGLAVVLRHRAALFVDGRYTLQAQQQVDKSLFACKHSTENPAPDWVAENLPPGGRLGFDPWLHTPPWVEKMRTALARVGGSLVPVEPNPIDALWRDQPPAPIAPVVPHDLAYAGVSSAEKRAEIAAFLEKDGIEAAVLNAPDSIAWLLNIRGGDVPHTPSAQSFAILKSSGEIDLFIDRRKLTRSVERHLGNAVAIAPIESFGSALDGLAGRRVAVDPQTSGVWIFERLAKAGAEIRRQPDPCVLPRARKNEVELAGARAAHARDGAAVARFLSWLSGAAAGGAVDEIGAADRLRQFRSDSPLFRDLSFDTISGAGPNGAITHYRATPETNRRLEPGSLYLVDSGAQYPDGTTDVTRTVSIGTPTEEMRRCFTLVLKGHIALARTRFPKGTTGSQIDMVARQYLWTEGLDYDHGTGHGVGSYLGVHEGPARISKLPNSVALEPGMILSNEPGFYKPGAWGIRIENLVVVQPCPELADAAQPMFSFETITLAPFDRTLIDLSLLTSAERAWVNAYHARVLKSIGPQLPPADRDWLAAATAPL